MRPSLKPANSTSDTARLRGRTSNNMSSAQAIDPTAWIRSASTSSLRKLRTNTHSNIPTSLPHPSTTTTLHTTPSSPPLPPTSESEILITKVHPKRLTTPVIYNDSMEKIWDPRDLRLIDQKDPGIDEFSNSPTPNNEPVKENKLDETIYAYGRDDERWCRCSRCYSCC